MGSETKEWWCAPENVRDVKRVCENPMLRLTKFVTLSSEGGNKQEELKAVCTCQERYGKAPVLDLPKQVEYVWGRLRSRLAVNLAGGILENANICLHPHLGYPYLPGSAVKGIARHVAWCEWNKLEGEAKKVIANRIVTVFGYPTNDKKLDEALKATWEKKKNEVKGHAGCVAFLGAFPEGKAIIEVDVLTCHHAKYYSGSKEKATDDEKPNVQFFPVAKSGVTFCFPLVPLRRSKTEKEMAEAMADAKRWLVEAITVNGAGAKTAAGYGWFKDVTEECAALREKWLAAERAKARLDALRAEAKALSAEAVTPESAQRLLARAEALAAEADTLKADEALRQRLREVRDKCRKALPKEAPVDILRRSWNSEKRILNDANGFLKAKAERQEAMLTLFSEAGTLPAEVYAKIRSGELRCSTQGAIVRAMRARQGGQA